MGFTLYDPNMNEIKYPVGVTPLDISVSSIEKERITEKVDGIPGMIDYGFNYKDREIKLNFSDEHYYDTHDYRLQRDDIYALFDTYPYMYVSDNKLPTRVLPITVDAQFTPERYGYWYSKFEISANICGLPFWRTKYTTQDIQNTGYSALVEKYGLADGIHQDYLNYSYNVDEFYIWNGGNVEIDPRNMPLKITIENVTSTGNFSIESFTNGDKFIYKEPLNKQSLVLDGTKVLVGANNMMRNSNRKFIRIRKSRNTLKIRNGTFSNVKVEFPFFYK